MVSLSIPISESDRALIERQAVAGGFRDSAEYILSLVEADRARQIRTDLETQLLEGLRSPSSPMPDEEWDDIRQVGERLIAERKPR